MRTEPEVSRAFDAVTRRSLFRSHRDVRRLADVLTSLRMMGSAVLPDRTGAWSHGQREQLVGEDITAPFSAVVMKPLRSST
jgi:hypothetical protein